MGAREDVPDEQGTCRMTRARLVESQDKCSRLRVEHAVWSSVCRDGRQRFYPAGKSKGWKESMHVKCIQ